MSVKTFEESNISSKSGISENRHSWVRPSDWTAMPTIGENENKIAMLFAVTPSTYSDVGSQFAAFTCGVSSGTYLVDWGDGTTNTYSGGVKAEHTYEPANISSAVTTRGYKTALIVVTPVTSGATFTAFSLQAHTNQPSIAVKKFLDIIANTTYASGATFNVGGSAISAKMLERALFNSKFYLSQGAFQSCNALRVLPPQLVFNPTPSAYNSTFGDCFELAYIPPLINFNISATSPTLSIYGLFQNCYRLKEIPYINIPDNVSPSYMCLNCFSITELPALNLKITGSAASAFTNCYKLKDLSKANFDFTNCTSVANMFQGCYEMTKAPSLSTITSACTSMFSTFQDCRKMEEIPPMGNTSGVTTFQSTFNGCLNIISVKDTNINISSATTIASIFTNCTNLVDVYYPFSGTFKTTGLVTGGLGSVFSISQGSMNRIVIGQTFPTATSGNISGPGFPTYSNLSELEWTGINQTFTIANNQLSGVQLNNIYNNLASGVSGKTITVTGNWGTATDTPSIATAKGWTVTG